MRTDDDEHLQDVAAREGVDDGGRDDVEDEVDRASGSATPRRHSSCAASMSAALGVTLRPTPGCVRLTTTRPITRASVRDGLEVDGGTQPDPADLLHRADLCQADDDRREDDRTDQHANQLDEAVAERAHRGACLRPDQPDADTERDGDEDLGIEAAIERELGGH